MCKVSIIIPIWNAEKYIDSLLKSLLNQSFQDFEIICVNDGSTDCSAQILEEYKKKDDRIHVYTITNSGPANARNYGIQKAKGEYIQFIDADDHIELNMLEAFASVSFSSDIVVSGVFYEYEKTNKTECKVFLKPGSCTTRNDIIDKFRCFQVYERKLCLNYLWNKWFKRSFLINNQIQQNSNFNLGEDFLFVSEAFMKANSFIILPKAYYHYMIRGEDSLVNRFDPNESYRRKIMYATSIKLYDSFGLKNEKQKELRVVEGEYCWNGLLKINYKDCKLNKSEKINYIRNFLCEPHIKCLLTYLRSDISICKGLLLVAVLMRNAHLIYYLIKKNT